MKEQILKIIEAEGLTPAKFADEIGVQRSSISHIISGRNKPSYDFIMKIIDRFRGINAEWLLTGKGSMIKSSEMDNSRHQTIFEAGKHDERSDISPNKQAVKENINIPESIENSEKDDLFSTQGLIKNKSFNSDVTNVNSDSFILVFYEDGTYKRFSRRE